MCEFVLKKTCVWIMLKNNIFVVPKILIFSFFLNCEIMDYRMDRVEKI